MTWSQRTQILLENFRISICILIPLISTNKNKITRIVIYHLEINKELKKIFMMISKYGFMDITDQALLSLKK